MRPKRTDEWESHMALVTGDEFTKTVLKRWEDIGELQDHALNQGMK